MHLRSSAKDETARVEGAAAGDADSLNAWRVVSEGDGLLSTSLQTGAPP
jgi:hypothetical protein